MSTAFIWNVRVYYEDTDAGGIVFYANYLKFFERARTEWLRAVGVSQQTLSQTHATIFVVKSAIIDFQASAKLDDELKITTQLEKLGRASVHFSQEAWRGTQLLTRAKIKVGCVDGTTLRPCAMPDDVLLRIKQQ